MKIKTKFMIGYTILMTVMLILAAAGVTNLAAQSAQLEKLQRDRYAKMLKSYEVRGKINELAEDISSVLIEPTQANLDKHMPMMTEAGKTAAATFEELKAESESEIEDQVLNRLTTAGDKYVEYASKAIELIKQGKPEEAVALRQEVGMGYQKELLDTANQMADFHRKAMDRSMEQSLADNRATVMIMNIVTAIGLLIGIGAMLWNMRSLGEGLQSLSIMIKGFAQGTIDASARIKNIRKDEFGDVAKAFNGLAEGLEEKAERELVYNTRIEEDSWVKTNLTRTIQEIQNVSSLDGLSRTFIRGITPIVGAQFGALYVREGLGEQNLLKLQGAFAFGEEAEFDRVFAFGQGLVGECAQDGEVISVNDIPENDIKVQAGFGEIVPQYLLLIPVKYQAQLLAVIELAAIRPYTPLERRLLDSTAESLGIVINNLFGRMKVEELLRESQALSEELQAQSEELLSQQNELKQSNDKLEEHTRQLKKSEELLQSQQEELEQSNEELLQKTHMLELQMKQTEQKNEQIEKTKAALEKQTVQLALSSKYKSEFLTNMSHELRTPLNSLLILSQMLKDNKEGNLTEKQVEFAGTIHASGSDLLKLIDEILDLSKISAGKMNVVTENVPLEDVEQFCRRSFLPVSLQKNVRFETKLEPGLPEEIYTDSHRLKQILKNFLSNAFKFTKHGTVTLTIRNATLEESGPMAEWPDSMNKYVAFEVKDTGIGIPADKQQLIFEAFQQVDGTTSRVYGGTGLGLAISRELADLLGGAIRLTSTEGSGSTFTLYMPEFHVSSEQASRELHDNILNGAFKEVAVSEQQPDVPEEQHAAILPHPVIEDDAHSIQAGDRVVLIIEDDVSFAKVLLDIARSRGFKGIVALQGDKGLSYARTYRPDAILLDIQLPVIDGWSILNQLKHHSETRHIPVHVISVLDDIQDGLSMGAIAYLKKPIDKDGLDKVFTQIESFLERNLKHLLIVEDDAAQRKSMIELIGHDDILITAVSTGRETMALLREQHFDCMVLDLGLPDISGFELLDEIRKEESIRDLPIIIYTARDLDAKEEQRLKKNVGTIIIKDVKSPERLLDETTLFLHRVEANLPDDKRDMLRKLHSVESIFEGKNILIVDDDIRNVFALSSVLESYKMNIAFAENGKEALEQLRKNPNTDLILMDIMMPEMDGYETMREIRLMSEYKKLPIIAVTAKAMKDDRDKCIEAGASDYIAKPVNTEQLLSLMRVWLYK
ncbi:response regulator [Paenibacillus sp. N4]|uniref:response regulator n=1 Tax=Paenibacillus vietnamensis TaxID=2590547 RepID=UPI001CD12789|nr:response regulator [Paenibacillus vietnamensis]MCA0756845.1 response regulator [Paenibacillus vietnamensis]